VVLAVKAPAAEESALWGGDLCRSQRKWTAKAGTRKKIQVAMEIKSHNVSVAIKTSQGLDFEVQGELRLDETTSPRSLEWK